MKRMWNARIHFKFIQDCFSIYKNLLNSLNKNSLNHNTFDFSILIGQLLFCWQTWVFCRWQEHDSQTFHYIKCKYKWIKTVKWIGLKQLVNYQPWSENPSHLHVVDYFPITARVEESYSECHGQCRILPCVKRRCAGRRWPARWCPAGWPGSCRMSPFLGLASTDHTLSEYAGMRKRWIWMNIKIMNIKQVSVWGLSLPRVPSTWTDMTEKNTTKLI